MTADGPGTIVLDLSLESQHPIVVQVADGTYGGVVGHAPSDSTIEYRESPATNVAGRFVARLRVRWVGLRRGLA
jgi:hypothetical protein